MLIPRRVKHRKQHRPDRRGAAKGGTRVSFGEYGIQAVEHCVRHQPADRGRSYRHHPTHQAWWQGLDHHLSRPADHEEAGRDTHGLR